VLNRYLYTVDVFYKLIYSLFLFTISRSKVEFINRVTIEGSLIFLNNRVITVDSYRAIIVRDRKGEYLLVKLFLPLYRFK